MIHRQVRRLQLVLGLSWSLVPPFPSRMRPRGAKPARWILQSLVTRPVLRDAESLIKCDKVCSIEG